MTTSFRLKPDAMARLACAAALAFLVFAGSRTLVGERRFSPPSPPSRTSETPTPEPTPPVERLTAETWQVPTNLFASTHVSNYLARVATEKAAAEEAARKAAGKAAAEAARKAAEEEAARKTAVARKAGAEAAPKPAFVEFTYRGMMRRTDATEWALIAAVPGGGTNFYRAGDLCRGLTVTNIRYRQVGLIVSNGVPETLNVGQPLKVPEELCHDHP